MSKPVNVLAICGSLRKGSFNRMAMKVAMELAPEGMSIGEGDISALPVYNEDLRQGSGFPAPVEALRSRVAAADALLFVTPEYNFSIPAPMKNAIDWVSRPPNQPFNGKPVAIMGASMGLSGTVRAQLHLRQSCVFLNMFPLNKPEILIGQAQNKFDASGKLTDDVARGLIKDLLVALAAWTHKLRGD
ncbi:MAG TPA: NADPH-dependent FMN reductase [Candidatus Cybelea sp.]|nr:NADPH-dependent FMN reductase [Candidatus Cybelea sp.]